MARVGGEPATDRLHRSSARVRRTRRAILRPILARCGGLIFQLLSCTWRRALSAQETNWLQFDRQEGCLLLFWHGRSLAVLRALRGMKAAVLVSPSADGELSMAVLRRLGYPVIRGSSSRGAARAMREMLETLKSGTSIAITPDGPRGPMHSVTDGVAWLAHQTGYPIVPVGIHVPRALRLKSWDRFTVPLPWTRIRAHFGAPIRVPPEWDDEAVRGQTEKIRAALLEAEREAATRAGAESEV